MFGDNKIKEAKKFLRFRYAAIRRYGDKFWTAADGYIEFNPTYTVNGGYCEKGIIGEVGDIPYIIELSNGTKFMCFIHGECGNVFSEEGEKANNQVSEKNFPISSDDLNHLNNRYK